MSQKTRLKRWCLAPRKDKGRPGEGRQSRPKFACKGDLSWTQQGAVKAMLASACTEMRANTLASVYMEMTAIEEKEGVKEEPSCLDPRALG